MAWGRRINLGRISEGGNLGLAWDFGQIVWRPHRDTVLHTRRGPRTTPRAPPPTIAMAPLASRSDLLLPGRGRGGTHPVDSRRPLPPRRGSPWAGVLAAVVLVFGIAQVPALTVTLPAIAWVWSRGGTGTGEALIYTAHWLDSGMADNVLKPLMLGPRGPACRLTYLSLVAQARLGPSDVRRMDQRTGFAWRSRSERSFTCGRSGKDRQAWRVRRAVP